MSGSRPLGLRAAAARRGLLGYGTVFSLAACVGVLAALGAISFRFLEQRLLGLAYGAAAHDGGSTGGAGAWVGTLTPAAGILVAAFIVRVVLGRRDAGLDVMEVTVLRRGPMALRREVLRVLAALGVVGTGGSVGPEGPVVELGAALGSSLSRTTRVRRRDASVYASCGAAAGLAAAFNAPIGAAMFVLEIMIGRLSVERFAPVVVASVTATAVRHAALGSDAVFLAGSLGLESAWEYAPVVCVGVLGGLVGAVFLRVLDLVQAGIARVPLPWWGRAAAGGVALGLVGLLFAEVRGSGVGGVNAALGGEIALHVCGILIIAKMLATAVTLGSGGLGGVFLPTLFLGAVMGSGVGVIVHQVTDGASGPPGAYALAGMAATVGATLHAPVTAILLVFELSRDYELVPAVMLATITATVIARRLHPFSLYTARLRARGVRPRGGEGDVVLASTHAESAMDPPPLAVGAAAPISEVLDRVEAGAEIVYVEDAAGRLAGSIAASRLAGIDVEALGPVAVAGDLLAPVRPVSPTSLLSEALEAMDVAGSDEVPVADASGRLAGVVTRRALLRRVRAGE